MIIDEKIKITNRQQLILELYKSTFPDVASFVRKMGGSLNDAKDIFQDAIVIYYEKQAQASFVPEHGHDNYLLGIAKNLWYKQFKKVKSEASLEAIANLLSEEQQPKVSQRLERLLISSGKRCMDLLAAFYYDKLSMADIASRFGFSGERSATAQKYKCIEKLRDVVKKNTLNKDDFYE